MMRGPTKIYDDNRVQSQDRTASSSRDYYAALDGFRGVFALIIAVYHTLWLTNVNTLKFLDHGQILVDLFFAFSGFLMFRLYAGKLSTRAQASDYMRRRIARIYPLHFVMLMVFVGYSVLRVLSHSVGISVHEAGEILPFQPGAAEGLASFFANLTLTQSMGLFDTLTYNSPAWTVSVEFFAYIVFLGIMLIAPPKKLIHFIVLAVCIAAIYVGLSRVKPSMDITHDYGFWRCLGGFFTGVLGAYIFGNMKKRVPMARSEAQRFGFTLLEVFTLAVLYGFVVILTGKGQFWLPPVALLFVVTFAFGRGHISALMSSRPALYLGKISYSIYMVHFLISIVFNVFAERVMPGIFGPNWNINGFGGDLLLIPYLAVVIGISHYSYIYVERAGQRTILKFRLSDLFNRRKAAEV